MGVDAAAAPPVAKLVLTNLQANPANEGAFRLTVQFNPSTIQEDLTVTYARPNILGGSHRPLQYLGTENLAVPMTLFFSSRNSDSARQLPIAKRFLQSLAYPMRGSDSIVTGSPPRVLVSWPNFMSLTTKITQLSIRTHGFRQDGFPLRFTARCTFENIQDLRWTSEDAFAHGSIRVGNAAQGAS